MGVTVTWADNNGITRSRTVPVGRLESVAETGIGITPLFAVFDSQDGIVFTHQRLSTPSGDIRLVPQLDRLVRLSGQPGFAWAPGRQVAADGSPWPYDQRGVLERQVQRAEQHGLSMLAGYEMEFQLCRPEPGTQQLRPVHESGPSYGPLRTLTVDEFAEQLLRDLDSNGIVVNQFHGEYGPGQFELSITATDPVTAADQQLLARQSIHAAARAHGLRASFAPLVELGQVGNGWHLHTSISRDGHNLLSGGTGVEGMQPDGAAFLAGLLRELPAVVAVTAPSLASLQRRRPGYWSGAYGFWGVENREAALRLVPGSALVGARNANIELKPSDASANPYLAIAAVLAAGLGGIADQLTPPPPVQADPGTWTEQQRAEHDIALLPTTVKEQLDALLSNQHIRAALGEDLLDAFRTVRESDLNWATDHTDAEVLEAYRWLY